MNKEQSLQLAGIAFGLILAYVIISVFESLKIEEYTTTIILVISAILVIVATFSLRKLKNKTS